MTPTKSIVGLLIATGVVMAPSTALAEPALRLGFNARMTIQDSPAERPLALQQLRGVRANTVRLMWEWSSIERMRPPDSAARDPAWSGYDWRAVDATLRDVAAAGVTPIMTIHRAPSWWEGSPRPKISEKAPRGAWRPDAAAYGRFMHAAAARYSGSYPDPLNPGRPLPQVRLWQPWNEPNLAYFLSPQWTRSKNGYKTASPDVYRPLLAAAYDEIKSVSPGATVLSAATAPYGQPRLGGTRMRPARFVRDLLCVSGTKRLRARNCRNTPVKFDILAHNPYPIGPPTRRAINDDDVGVPDFSKLKRPLTVALRAGNVVPRGPKPIWATEMSWDTRPPDPRGVSLQRQARYAAGAMYVLYRQGVDAMIWWNLHDDPRGRGYRFGLQSGVYFRGSSVATSTPKPSAAVFRFPFVARAAGRSAAVWGLAPAPGPVTLQVHSGAAWRNLKAVTAASNQVFKTRVRARRGTQLRAVQSGEASPAFAVGKL